MSIGLAAQRDGETWEALSSKGFYCFCAVLGSESQGLRSVLRFLRSTFSALKGLSWIASINIARECALTPVLHTSIPIAVLTVRIDYNWP